MGKNDEALGRYFADNHRYADLINGFILNGQQIVRAEDLSPMDSRTHGSRKSKKSKYRDLIRRTAFGANFVILGVENQKEVNYVMPVRCMDYDAREYTRQISKRRRELCQQEELSKAEFLSGFKKEDKLHPCITFVLYYGDDWDGSKELVELLDVSNIPQQLHNYINNYRIHILDVKTLENTDVFRTDLKQVFDFIKYSKDKQKLKEISEMDSSYLELDEDAYEVAVAFTGAEELLAVKKKEGGDMCQALKELLQDEREEGREEGEKRLSNLIKILFDNQKQDEISKVISDAELRKQYYLQYNI